MSDLDRRLRGVDQAEVPDLWIEAPCPRLDRPRIERRSPSGKAEVSRGGARHGDRRVRGVRGGGRVRVEHLGGEG